MNATPLAQSASPANAHRRATRTPHAFAARIFLLGVFVGLGAPLSAQPAAPTPAVASAPRFEAAQLDELLGPVALYPDALIALILPASTAPSDVVLAARFLRDGGDPAQVENQPWDDSVRALARYPEVLKWMDENLAWTKQLGEVFAAQSSEAMDAVQRLRAKARAAGSLVDTPQQQVVMASNVISIVPTQPDAIYVPYYDPEVVYVATPAYARPAFRFGPAYATGFWLSYTVDWHQHRVWCVNRPDRERYWRENRSHWHRPSFAGAAGFVTPPHYYRSWTPRSGYTAPQRATVSVRTAPIVSRPDRIDRPATRFERRDAGQPHATNDRYYRPNAPSHVPAARLAHPLPQPMPSPLPQPLPRTTPRPFTPSPSVDRAAPATPRATPGGRERSFDSPAPRYRAAPAPAPAAPVASVPPSASLRQRPAPTVAPVVENRPIEAARPETNGRGENRGNDAGERRAPDNARSYSDHRRGPFGR